jgi:hypothetical protein
MDRVFEAREYIQRFRTNQKLLHATKIEAFHSIEKR